MRQRGRLKIFFSYADGTGKTRAMLRAAHEAKKGGLDVVAGILEGEAAAARGLPFLRPRELRREDGVVLEFNLDAALARAPRLILIDDLAHVNAGPCRHERRYQDVQELLRAGVDVYTTLNVDQLEGMREAVRAASGREAQAPVPDSVFDEAEQVEFVDRDPAELVQMAPEGALRTLAALRALALRRCADRVGVAAGGAGERAHVSEHILVCLSSAPSNARVIRMAARMAGAFRCACTAIYVRSPSGDAMGEANRKRLLSNMKLAEQLGAKVEIVAGEDVALQIAEYARVSGVTQIVLGRSVVTRTRALSKPSITDRLIQLMPGIEIHILPDGEAQRNARSGRARFALPRVTPSDFVRSLAILAMASALSLAFYALGFGEENIIMAYILGVLLTAVVTGNKLCSVVSSIASVFIFNYLFTEPRFTLKAYGAGYPVTFLIMFLAAFITGTLASQLKNHARESAQTAYRTGVLFETNQQLSQASDRDEILSVTAGQLIKLFRRDVIFYPVRGGALEEGRVYAAQGEADAPELQSPQERRVAEWVLKNNRQAGASTDTFAQAHGLYLAVRINESVYGVVGVQMGGQAMEHAEHSMLLAILGECALAMENERNVREKEAAAMQARSEQLRADLLRAISHDLRTPLTSISGNASNLLSNGSAFDEDTRRQIYTDIYQDALWLINLVENLLYVTRIEDGRMKLRCSVELIDEVLQEALRHEACKGREHEITLKESEALLLAHVDARLIIQVVINLVDNAIKYTPPGAHIVLSARREGAWVLVSCADDGPGISDADKPHIFEMFYSGGHHCADSRRSLGLGLGLCKSIVNAHGGTICVRDNVPRGTIIEFSVPEEEVQLNEQAADSGC